MNIFLRELKANLRSLIIWGLIVIFFIWAGFSKFAAYEGNPELMAMLDSMPAALMEAFQMNAFNLTTVTGFFGVMYNYYALLLTISAVMWGSDIITKEERDKTVEFSLTLPVARSRLVTAKTAAALVNCVALLFIAWGISLAGVARYQADSDFYRLLTVTMLSLFILQLVFLAIGVLLGCAMKRHKLASAVAVGALLGAYFLSVISGLHENLDFLKYFSPFTYFNPASLMQSYRLDLGYVWLSAAIIAVSLVGAYVTYSRRDLYI